MTWIVWLAGTRIGRAIVVAVGAALGVFGIYRAGMREGGQRASEKALEADTKRADKIRERADDARKRSNADSRDVDDRLRDHDRLRDG